MQGEDTVEIAHLQHPPHPWFGDDELEVAVEESDPLERADQHTEPERVDEVDAGQVENEVVEAVGHGMHHVLAQLGRADDVELAGHGENRPLAVSVSVHHDVHPSHGIGPHPCDSVTGGS